MKQSTKWFMPSGESVKDFCRSKGIKYKTVWDRCYRLGWSLDQAIMDAEGTLKAKSLKIKGVPLQTACLKEGINQSLVMLRHSRSGESLIDSFNYYVRRKECLKNLRY